MDTASLAEPTTGETIATLRQWSEEYRLALAGSYIAVSYTHLDVYKRQAPFNKE